MGNMREVYDALQANKRQLKGHRISESNEQIAVMQWAVLHEGKWPELKLLHQRRRARTWKRLKRFGDR